MYLELAEQAKAYPTPTIKHGARYSSLDDCALNDDNPYIFVPDEEGGGVYVREDYFDNLPIDEYRETMLQLEGYQQDLGFLGIGKKGRDRREGRREKRHARKLEKKGQRFESKESRVTTRAEGGGGAKAFFQSGGLQRVSEGIGTVVSPIAGAVRGQGELFYDDYIEDQPFYKNPIVIGGGIAAIALVAFLATRKKK